MFRLVREGTKAQRISPVPRVPTQTSTVPFATKRGFLVDLLEAHGAKAILNIPDALDRLEPEPALQALQLASDPIDLMKRWGRLELFTHSRHRVDWTSPAQGHILLEHTSLKQGEVPTHAEGLLVFALIIKLTEQLADNVVAGPIGQPVWREGGAWTDQTEQGYALAWQMRYRTREDKLGPETNRSTSRDIVNEIRELIGRDFNRRWRIEQLARHFGTSRRNFQRTLQNSGTHFSALVDSARVARAAQHLTESTSSIAEIGFICGFADQPHFTRSFRRSTGLTPAIWRQSFASAQS